MMPKADSKSDGGGAILLTNQKAGCNMLLVIFMFYFVSDMTGHHLDRSEHAKQEFGKSKVSGILLYKNNLCNLTSKSLEM